MEYCEGHISFAERVAKAETKIVMMCEQDTTILGKIDSLSNKIDEAIKGKLSKGTVLTIVALTNAVVALTVLILKS